MNRCAEDVWEVVETLPGNAREIWNQAFVKALGEVHGDTHRAAAMAWRAFKKQDQENGSVRNWQKVEKGLLLVAVYGGMPEWVKLVQNDGLIFNGAHCPCLVDRKAFDAIIAKSEQWDEGMVVLLENYQPGGQPALVVGWIKNIKYHTDGLWVKVEWTEDGLGYITRKEFAYLGLGFILDESNRPVELWQARLTNYPWLHQWEEVPGHLCTPKGSRTETGSRLRLLKDVNRRDVNGGREDCRGSNPEMADKEKAIYEGKQFLNDMKGLLGLSGKVSFENVKWAIAKLKAQQDTNQNIGSEPEVRQLLRELIGKTVEEAIKKGLIKPEQRNWAEVYATRDWPGFQEFLSLAAATFPLKARRFPHFWALLRWTLAKPQENGSANHKNGCSYYNR